MTVIQYQDIPLLHCAECSHRGIDHHPSAVTPYSRSSCRFDDCGCGRFALSAVAEVVNWTPYVEEPGCRYGLVLHQGALPTRLGILHLPPLMLDLPSIDAAVYRKVGYHVWHRPPPGPHRFDDDPAFFHAGWRGGHLNHVHDSGIYIYRCGCSSTFHLIGESELPGIVAAMRPLLEWTNANSTHDDWLELVPVPTGADRVNAAAGKAVLVA